MMLTKEELLDIKGGALTSSMMSALVKGASLLFEIGQSFGSALRRAITKTTCVI